RASSRPPALFLGNHPCPDEAAEMKGQGRRRDAKTGLDVADLHAIQATPDQQPVDVQPGQVAQLRQALRSEFAVHELNLPERFAINNYIPSFMGVSLRQSKCGMPYWPTELSSLRQRLKERASRHRPLTARLHHRGQDSFHAPKTDDLCADLGQMIDSDVMRAAARPGLLVGQV